MAIVKFLFIFLLFIPIKSLSNPCLKEFTFPPGKQEYSSEALKIAMSNDYKSLPNYPKLSQEDTTTLLNLYRNGDKQEKDKAFQILFLSHFYVIIHIAKKWRFKAEYDDLFQEGVVVFLNTLETFDTSQQETKFVTYLYRSLSNRLVVYVQRTANLVSMRWSPERSEIYKAFIQARNSADFEIHLESWFYEFSQKNPQYSIKNIRLVKQFILQKFLGYDEPLTKNEDKDSTVGSLIADTSVDVELEAINEIDSQKIYSWIERRFPDDISKAILRDILFTSDPKTFTAIGEDFSITRQAIIKRYNRMIRLIREYVLDSN